MNRINDKILIKYLEKRCTEEEYLLINDWIKESKENARRLFLLEEMYWTGKRNAQTEQMQMEKAEHYLFQRLENESTRRSSIKRAQRLIIKYAATVAILIVTGSGIGYWMHQLHHNSELLTVYAKDTIQFVTLPDATKVWLNSSTTLRYPRQFTGSNRNVYLDGEAYFEVTTNAKQPFIVESEMMNITVLGTTFNFKCNKDNPLVEASLIEGEIIVESNKQSGMVTLLPGQKIELSKSTGHISVKETNTKLDAVWHNELIPVESANIFGIAQILEQFYAVKISFSPGFKSNKTYSGVLKKQDTIDSVLKSLNNVIPFSYKITNENVFISIQH